MHSPNTHKELQSPRLKRSGTKTIPDPLPHKLPPNFFPFVFCVNLVEGHKSFPQGYSFRLRQRDLEHSCSVAVQPFFREHGCEGGESFQWFKRMPFSRPTPIIKVVALLPRSSKMSFKSL